MFFFKKKPKIAEEENVEKDILLQPKKVSPSRRIDIRKILIIGSGASALGQVCDFDFLCVQAAKALKEEDYQIIAVNPSASSVMIDSDIADKAYIEPLTVSSLEEVIRKERPDAVLSRLGGKVTFNLIESLSKLGILRKYKVEIIGIKPELIEKIEDIPFKKIMLKLGIPVLKHELCASVREAKKIVEKMSYPLAVKTVSDPSNSAGSVVYNIEELKQSINEKVAISSSRQVVIEKAILGWEEIEVVVARDKKNHKITIGYIENIDPMGINRQDSCCVTPAIAAPKELQKKIQKYAYKIIEVFDVLGVLSVRFAYNPKDDKMAVISADFKTLSSAAFLTKAMGFPVARISAKLAVGITMGDIPYWKKGTLQRYETGGDYVAVRFPRWVFERFSKVEDVLNLQTKSIGEVVGLGKTFKEAFQKGIRSLNIKRYGLGVEKIRKLSLQEIKEKLIKPSSERYFLMYEALRKNMLVEEVYKITHVNRQVINEIKDLVLFEEDLLQRAWNDLSEEELAKAKEWGFSDKYLAMILGVKEKNMRRKRISLGKIKQFDTISVSGVESGQYYYSTYVGEDKVAVSQNKKVMILGTGPNRIEQGKEFDYMCVQAIKGLKEQGYEVIVVNCDIQAVSAEHDIADKLYFEPVEAEDIMDIYEKEKAEGIITQFGGKAGEEIAQELKNAGANILGTNPEVKAYIENKQNFREKIIALNIPQPKSGVARSIGEILDVAKRVGYPVIARSAQKEEEDKVEIVYDDFMMNGYVKKIMEVNSAKPLVIDKFIEKGIEAELIAFCDGEDVVSVGIAERIGLAGVHPGDSVYVVPAKTIKDEYLKVMEEYAKKILKELEIKGIASVRYVVWEEKVYFLEVDLKATRMVGFFSKVTATPIESIAAQLMTGKKITDFLELGKNKLNYFAVKEATFPFSIFPEVQPVLGPKMQATGSVIGVAGTFGLAFYKAQEAAGLTLPLKGNVLVSVTDKEKIDLLSVAKKIKELGFNIYATEGTNRFLKENGVEAKEIKKIHEGRPNISDAIKNKDIHLIINTPTGRSGKLDDSYIRVMATKYKVPYITSMAAAKASIEGIEIVKQKKATVKPIQDFLKEIQ